MKIWATTKMILQGTSTGLAKSYGKIAHKDFRGRFMY
jgi:hypothetical protein